MENFTFVNTTYDLSNFLEYRIAININLYYPPILVCVGLAGNILSFLVYIQRERRKTSLGIYLAALAVLDGIMCCSVFQYWLLHNFLVQLIKENGCYFMTCFVLIITNFSHWLIVVITIDRFIAISFPIRKFKLITARRAKITLIFIGSFCLLKNLHYIWTTDFLPGKNINAIPMCSFGLVRKGVSVTAYKWFEVFFSSILPFVIIVSVNICIICKIKENGKKVACQSRRQSNPILNIKLNKEERSITIILLMVSLLFVGLTAPLFIHRVYYNRVILMKNMTITANYYLSHQICHNLWYTNHAINFFIYSIFGKSFRDDLKKLFTRKLKRIKTFDLLCDIQKKKINIPISIISPQRIVLPQRVDYILPQNDYRRQRSNTSPVPDTSQREMITYTQSNP